MAKTLKNDTPSTAQAPRFLVPIMEAFHVESDAVARGLIESAAQAIYSNKDYMNFDRPTVSSKEIANILSIMRSLNPKDAIETLFSAQIVVGHLLGMRKIAESCTDDQRLGLQFLKFSNEALERLNRKRIGGMQNITVNYNHSGSGNSLIQAAIAPKGKE